jgi:ABC-2 type transport system permease protein
LRVFLQSLWQLLLARFRILGRDRGALFWVFLFPIVLSVGGGVAVRERGPEPVAVAVAEGANADALVARLQKTRELRVQKERLSTARDLLRRGRVALVLVPGEPPEALVNPNRSEAITARLLVHGALASAPEDRAELFAVRELSEPGTRYVDFLVPGALGLGLVSTTLFGIGVSIAQMRSTRVLKRMVATPLNPAAFLLSWVIWRGVLVLGEIALLLVSVYLLLDVRVFGSVGGLFGFALFGVLCLSCVALFISSRSQSVEVVEGYGRMFHLSALAFSGVFFSTSHFPAWLQPVTRLHPTTALIDGLRAIMVDGAPIVALWPESLVLAGWGFVAFVLTIRIFRWN